MSKKMLHPYRKFSDAILALPVNERVEFFSGQRIRHSILQNAYDDLCVKANSVGGVEFVQLVGPTGAGKSCAAKKFVKDKMKENKGVMELNSQMIPVIYVECPASISDKFSWKQLLVSILKTGGDVLAETGRYTLEYSEGLSQKDISRVLLKQNSVSDLFEVVRNFLKHRNVSYLVIDEAQHIIDACQNAKEAFRCMEMLKSLANLSNCVVVLAGTYRLLRFGEVSAQLGRRSEIVELGPYHRNSNKDLRNFALALDALLARYPIAYSDDIYNKVNEIHLACCGCVGILKDLLTKTLYRTLQSGKSYVSYQALMNNRMNSRELKRVADEINMGKEYFSRGSMIEVEEILLGVKTAIKKPANTRGVQRKPGRDAVGSLI